MAIKVLAVIGLLIVAVLVARAVMRMLSPTSEERLHDLRDAKTDAEAFGQEARLDATKRQAEADEVDRAFGRKPEGQ